MSEVITLENAYLQMRVDPQGGRVLSLFSRTFQRPVLYEAAEPGALFPMLPLANRVAGNRFWLQGREVTLPQSPADAQFFLHGDGWLKRWQVAAQSAGGCELRLESRHDCGFDYQARLRYTLTENALQAELHLTHRGERPMLYGLGFHPWFPFSPGTRAQFSASGYWPEGDTHLPREWQPVLPPAADFSQPQAGCDEWLNVCYSGWSGQARLLDDVMCIMLFAQTPWLMLFRISGQPFLCLEPQTHPVNAHRQPGQPGLLMLQKGESARFAMTIMVTSAAESR
ncbi:Aldose 1-epimerase [Edwardsiella anguillarum]|uniref:Aldose 1-epimerase n=1 Tax=Edwardsiella anguillarum ET080813 TaxID=667120 RepID=A0A076LKC5_9GAMM|nr:MULTISPECIES: aldose 1-epimerase [Edwardsiella]AKM47237.1 aldose epimerase [Edwardsiella sp. EA181011]GAJ69222.1 aldose 1-epimerase [Edwardsiella piscicida]AIJ07118.1 aldose 1-epimerase [Edwardsiella anguillarum ET080813]AKR78483.2 aldose 1-epimerase [Edwardsiella sp. LADL05-105]KAB0591023.1 aldose 1-epimerase [Edwardsiella anguillarum]